MHPRVYQEFEKICLSRKAGGRVLEIGAVANHKSLLNMKCLSHATEKIGINLWGPYQYKDYKIIQGNANKMDCFDDDSFDTVLCNAVFEHDKFFWKSIAEVKRVAKPGGLIVIGTPGYKAYDAEEKIKSFFRKIPSMNRCLDFWANASATYRIHDAPNDYYRFSAHAFREVFLEGFEDIRIGSIMTPPRIIGSAIKPQT